MRGRRNQYRRRRRSRYTYSGGLNFQGKDNKIVKTWMKELLVWMAEILLTIGIAALLVFYFGVRIPVVGQSMAPTLEGTETVLVNRFLYKMIDPKPNDLIVFLPNGNEKSHYYIKRVIGVPGDTVQIKNGCVYVNGEQFDEKIDDAYTENGLLAEEAIVVKTDEFFVLGDNRSNSEDSRYANIGNVKKEHIVGKAWFIVSPFDKFGFLK